MSKSATLEKLKTGDLKKAPMPNMAAFVKLPIGLTVKGTLKEAVMEIEHKKSKKGKTVEKERYHFRMELAEDVTLLVGPKKKTVEQAFKAGTIVTLPEHGYIVSAMRRVACELVGAAFDVEANTDLKPLVGVYFEITRQEDKEISKGEFAGTSSAIYDVQYRA